MGFGFGMGFNQGMGMFNTFGIMFTIERPPFCAPIIAGNGSKVDQPGFNFLATISCNTVF